MCVVSSHAAAVSYDYHVPVAVVPTGKLYDSRLACTDWIPPTSLDIYARVKLLSSRKRISAITKDASNARTRGNRRTLLVFRIRFRRRTRAIHRTSTRVSVSLYDDRTRWDRGALGVPPYSRSS